LDVEKQTRVKSIASLENQEAELLQRIRETQQVQLQAF